MYDPKVSLSDFSTNANLLKLKFSPILAILLVIVSSKVPSVVDNFNASSTLLTFELIKAFEIVLINSLNSSFLATKSVSEFTSITTALLPFIRILTSPSAAILSAFLAALEIPFSLNHSEALSRLPSVASKAYLQSSIPAPVNSLKFFTILAVIIIYPPKLL